MFYYEVAISGNTRGARGIFTYSSQTNLPIGQCVVVLLKGKTANGFIVKISSRPKFKTNDLVSFADEIIPENFVQAYTKLCGLYPHSEQSIAQLFMPPKKTNLSKDIWIKEAYEKLPKLNPEQGEVLNGFIGSSGNLLLHGDTGTGKTRLYMHLMKGLMNDGRSVILLAPEIGLSSFLYESVKDYLPNVILYHSGLSTKQRYSIWKHVSNSTEPVCIVGPRSVLGLPINNIGLIAIDESHDQSYRQENSPHINAKVIAAVYSSVLGCRVVYGSATPLVSDYFLAKNTSLPIARIQKLAINSGRKSKVTVASYTDKDESRAGSILKSSLRAIEKSLASGGQSMVLINRRGTARHISCVACGHEIRCTTCEHLLTYHHDRYELRCHYCEKSYAVPQECPSCGAAEIQMRSLGAKSVVEELSKEFPDADIRRFDTDTNKDNNLSASVKDLQSGKIQIIVGTQMIAKGLDLPKLQTLVVFHGGVSSGFMSEERDFELIYQVLGRAIRGHQDSEIIIQTSDPNSKILKHAINRDYENFYKSELSERKAFNYPPYCNMMIIHVRRKTSIGAKKACLDLSRSLARGKYKLDIGSPTPDKTERIGKFFYWHILIKASRRSDLIGLAGEIGTGYDFELDPVDLP